LIVVSATRQKNVRQKNKRCHFSVLHFSVWLVLVAETTIKAQQVSTASGSERHSLYCPTVDTTLARGTDPEPSHALITPPLGSTLCRVQIVNRANLPTEMLTALERELPRFGTLQEFVLWGRARAGPRGLSTSLGVAFNG